MSESNQNHFTIHVLLSTGIRKNYQMPQNTTVSDLINQINCDSTVEKQPDKIISIIYYLNR